MEYPPLNHVKPVVLSELSYYNQRAFASRNRKYPIIGQTKDVDGCIWDIRDVRATKHGFDLYFGTPASYQGVYYGGLPRLIDTQPLYDFWDKNRLRGHGFLFDLPAGRTTLKRSRRRLGFNFDDDVEKHWTSLVEDLASLPSQAFAAKHNVKQDLARARRTRMVGKRARPLGWWRTPETITLLISDLTRKQVGAKLGISTSQVHRLRLRALAEQVDLHHFVNPADKLL